MGRQPTSAPLHSKRKTKTVKEVKNTRDWRTKIGGPLYEGFDWWK